jgi:hypothetical protein
MYIVYKCTMGIVEVADRLLLQAGLNRDALRDHIVICIVKQAEEIAQRV